MIDKNQDGVLSRKEMAEGYKMVYGEKLFLEQEIDKIIDQIDLNNNGVIDYFEFVTATVNYKEMCTIQNLKSAFCRFDIDGNGEITLFEL